MAKEEISLYFRDGSSDKEYHARIEEQDGGFIVNCAWGRRGATLQTGTKTQAPVPYKKAKDIYDKLVREKTAKGYSPGAAGTPYLHTTSEQRDTGLRCQLLNAIEPEQAEALLQDDAFWAQEKFDGKRVLVRKQDGAVTGVNRKGLSIGIPAPIQALAASITVDFILDGECVGDRHYAFDLLALGGADLKERGYGERYAELSTLLGGAGVPARQGLASTQGPITPVQTARSAPEKRALLARLRAQNAEGVVFKRHDAPYKAGRPGSGGAQLKFKFTATLSAIVARANDKRSVALEVFDGGPVVGRAPSPAVAPVRRVAIGNVTIPPGAAVPAAGAIVEVRYLYCHRGGSLFQPCFLGLRDDVDAEACTAAQIKYKAENSDEDDA